MKKTSPAAARRYARALLDVALEKDAEAEVRRGLREAVSLVDAHADLLAVLAHPAVAVEKKKAVAKAVLEGRAPALVLRLLELLVERDRVALLPALERAYVALSNEHRKVVAAEAVSATPLEETDGAALGKAISALTGMGVDLESKVDPAVLGGLRVRIGGRVYDGTVRARLAALRERLVGGAQG